MMKLEFNADQKTKVAQLNEKTSTTFQNLTLLVMGPILAQYKPILPIWSLDKYEGAIIRFWPEKECCLT